MPTETSVVSLRILVIPNLSACETGLGHATPEGIYGLQRAFKKAGVRHIVVNVGEASDVASSLFMAEFYKAVVRNGCDIHDAFRKARQTVRQRYPDPYYWSGFLLWTDNLSCLQSSPRIKCQGLRSVEDIHKLFTGDGLFSRRYRALLCILSMLAVMMSVAFSWRRRSSRGLRCRCQRQSRPSRPTEMIRQGRSCLWSQGPSFRTCRSFRRS